MGAETKPLKLAVLIDAENASPKIADGLFDEIAKIGEAVVRRIYGDFSGSISKSWADYASKYAIITQQQFAHTAGKNASDIALVIDAMDILYTGRIDAFCLVSSDSDFTRLASRIREQSLDVYGFGEQKTPESFRRACKRFIYTENLVTPATSAKANEKTTPLRPLKEAAALIRKAIEQMDREEEWVHLGGVGSRLSNLAPDFDPRTYGFKKLSDLVRETDGFEISNGNGPIRLRLKRRQKAAA